MIIDTEKYRKLIKHMREEAQDYRSGKTLGRAFVDAEDVLDEAADAIGDLLAALTPPNEAPPCYRPDSDGCAYQCYDGDDEPIEKCKECPLCYSDKQRHYTPPNEPLTWNELAEMEDQPVYIVEMGARRYWALVTYVGKDTAYLMTVHDPDDCGNKELYGESWVAYRRPKEEEGKPTEPLNV